jgi:5-methylcytosine-specific restriction endonuclease McrBC regulatory subunit McrC
MTKMIVASGVAPSVIQDFSRGYLPQFEVTDRAETIYFESLVGGIEKIVRLGLMKSYVSPVSPPQWRGRLLVSETIKRHRSRGVHYRGEFDYKTLSTAAVENIALKTALALSLTWNEKHNPGAPAIGRARRLLALLDSIPIHDVNTATLASDIARSVQNLPSHFLYYRDPLWTAYLLLQRRLPGLATEGFVTFDSLVIDLSRVFESYVRRVLTDRAADRGWRVLDGNLMTLPLFSDGAAFRVQPDIVVSRDGKPVALLDATCLRTIVSRDLAT